MGHALAASAYPSVAAAAEVVRAEIGKDTAWTGEAVPLIVTLYSPGPFSGTASFDLPKLPRTAFVKAGNPVVGSQDVDGESYFTQRHEFTVFTQTVGEIVVPGFPGPIRRQDVVLFRSRTDGGLDAGTAFSVQTAARYRQLGCRCRGDGHGGDPDLESACTWIP